MANLLALPARLSPEVEDWKTNIPQEDFEANPIAAAVAAAEMHSAATRAKACLRSNAAYRAIPMKYAAASGLIQLPSASITPASAKFAHLDFGRTANAIAADIENANGSSEKYPTGRNQLLYAAA